MCIRDSAYAGQLVGIAYHNNTAGVAQRRKERLKQLDVHHDHLVQNDHIALQQVIVVMDKADHAAGIVHLQQEMCIRDRGMSSPSH